MGSSHSLSMIPWSDRESRPRIVFNMAMTLDGKSVLDTGQWHGLCSRADREKMDALRSQADMILVGAASLRADNALLYDRRNPDDGRHPRPVILSGEKGIDPLWKVWQRPHPPAVLVHPGEDLGIKAPLTWIGQEPERLTWKGWDELPTLLSFLHSNYHCRLLLVEGGPTINGHFFLRKLVDEFFVTIVPYQIGGSGSGPIANYLKQDILDFYLQSCDVVQSEIFLHYKRQVH